MNSLSIATLTTLVSNAKPEETDKLREYAIQCSNASEGKAYTVGMYLRMAADWLEMVTDDEAFENYRTNEECIENALKSLASAAGIYARS